MIWNPSSSTEHNVVQIEESTRLLTTHRDGNGVDIYLDGEWIVTCPWRYAARLADLIAQHLSPKGER